MNYENSLVMKTVTCINRIMLQRDKCTCFYVISDQNHISNPIQVEFSTTVLFLKPEMFFYLMPHSCKNGKSFIEIVSLGNTNETHPLALSTNRHTEVKLRLF